MQMAFWTEFRSSPPKKALFYGFENELAIKGGVIHITYEGGARSQWVDIFKWKFDSSKNDFVLIGRTYKIVDNANEYPTEKKDLSSQI